MSCYAKSRLALAYKLNGMFKASDCFKRGQIDRIVQKIKAKLGERRCCG